jgi:hypothetical protein
MNWEKHFRDVNRKQKYSMEYAVRFGADFGAMARGTPIAGTNGAVIPPGRYWIDTFDDAKGTRTQFLKWLSQKPEVHVETNQESNSDPFWDAANSGPNRLFTIFTIPKTASNYGISGVWFPTQALGFPTISTDAVNSSDDTVQKPDAPTSTEIAEDIARSIGKITGAGTQGLVENVSSGVVLKLGLIAGAIVLVMLLPGILTKHAVHAAL